jgi:iron(III) transport system permease protein
LLLFAFFLLVYGPLVALMGEASSYSLTNPETALNLAIPSGRTLGLLINSLGLALAVAAVGTGLGILAGSLMWRWQTGGRAYLRWFILVLAPVPPYLHALAWSQAIDSLNNLLRSQGWTTISLQGWIFAWWVQLMAFLPIAVGMALIGFESIDPYLTEAASLLRSDMQVFTRVVLPLSAAPIAAGSGLLFLLSITDYSVPSLFSANVYSLEIFAEYSASNQPATAVLLALPLLVVTMLVVTALQKALRDAAQIAPRQPQAWRASLWPPWFVCLQKCGLAVLLLQVGTLLASSILAVGSWEKMVSTIILASSEIRFTFWIALATALASVPVALAASMELRRRDVLGRVFWVLVTAPLAVPAPLVGIGLISLWSRAVWPDFYGSSAMPALAALARFAPLAAIVLLAQLRNIDPLLIDAAHVFQVKAQQTWVQIWLPLLAPGMLVAAGIAFALTSGELGATLIVAPPGQATLTMRIYNYLHYGASSDVAGLCLMMAVVTLAAGCLALLALTGWRPERKIPLSAGR